MWLLRLRLRFCEDEGDDVRDGKWNVELNSRGSDLWGLDGWE